MSTTMWDIFEPQQFEFNRGELNFSCRCPKCGKVFRQRCKLMHHITTKHVSLRHSRARASDGRQQLFQCTFCQVKFLHKQSLEGHVAMHHSSNSSGDAAGPLAPGSATSRTVHHSGGTFLFMCRECDEKFDCDYSLWCHLMLHALSRPSDYTEEDGGGDRQQLNRGRKQYQCAKCTLKFTRKKDLKAHRKSFHKYAGRVPFSQLTLSMQHQRQPPTEALFVSLFACDMCEEMFSGEGDLRQHRLSEHHHHHNHHHHNHHSPNAHLLGQPANHRLQVPPHQQFHNNYSDPYEKRDKPFKCNQCGARFAEKLYLKWHGNLHRPTSCRWTPRALFRRLFNDSALIDRLRCGTRFDLIANRRWHLTSKREKVLRAQSERYTLDLSLVEGVGSRLKTMVHSIGSAVAKWLPKIVMGGGSAGAEKKRAAGSHGIDKLYRTTCPNWYV